MSKFNLVNYKKSDSNAHISTQLEEQRTEAPTVITEKQLEKDRGTETNTTLEKQLEKVRKGAATTIIEKNLDDSKGQFSKMRDSSTYSGNLPKLEEKRIKSDKMEDEKYELASKVAKVKEWWTDLVPKTASNQQKTITAIKSTKKAIDPLNETISDELDFNDPATSFERARGLYGEGDDFEVVERDPSNEFIGDVQEATDVDSPVSSNKTLSVIQNKEFHPPKDPMDAIHIKLGFDPDAYSGNLEEVRDAALEKVLQLRPELNGRISTDDFTKPTVGTIDGTISLRLIGDEYFKKSNGNISFSELKFSEGDVGGTPVTMGRVQVNRDDEALETSDDNEIARDIVDFIKSKHPDLNITTKSLDLSKLDQGIVNYVVSAGEEQNDEVPDPVEVSPINTEVTTNDDADIAEEEFIDDENSTTPFTSEKLSKALNFSILEVKQAAEVKKKKTIG